MIEHQYKSSHLPCGTPPVIPEAESPRITKTLNPISDFTVDDWVFLKDMRVIALNERQDYKIDDLKRNLTMYTFRTLDTVIEYLSLWAVVF